MSNEHMERILGIPAEDLANLFYKHVNVSIELCKKMLKSIEGLEAYLPMMENCRVESDMEELITSVQSLSAGMTPDLITIGMYSTTIPLLIEKLPPSMTSPAERLIIEYKDLHGQVVASAPKARKVSNRAMQIQYMLRKAPEPGTLLC